jgi:hypothetical protein
MDRSAAVALDLVREDLAKRALQVAPVRDQGPAQRLELPRRIAMRAKRQAPKVLPQVLPSRTAMLQALRVLKEQRPGLRSPIAIRLRPQEPKARLLVQR